MVHAPLGWIAGDKLGQRGPQERLHDRDQDEAVDDRTWSAGVDFGDDAESKACPGDGRSGRQPDQRQHAKVTLQFLSVAYIIINNRAIFCFKTNIPICARRSSSASMPVASLALTAACFELESAILTSDEQSENRGRQRVSSLLCNS